MQNFLPTTNTTPSYLALDYFTPGRSNGFNEIRNDKQVAFAIMPVQQPVGPVPFIPDYEDGDTFSMAIGNFDEPPSQGVFSLQVGATTSGLANLAYNITATALQTALNAALTSEGKPLCTVLLASPGAYIITGATNGAITDGFFAVLSDSGLYPISNAFFTKDSNGSGTTPYRYAFTMRQAPMCYAEPTDPLPAADVDVENTQVFSADQSAIWRVLFKVPQVSAGSFTLNANANGVEATCGTITPLMDARAFGLVLAQHPEINYQTGLNEDNVAVTVSGQSWVVTAIADLADDATFELMATNSADDPLVGPTGLSGSINYNTFGLYVYSLSQNDESGIFTLTRQIQRTRGSETRTLYSGPVNIYKELIDAATAVPTPTISYYTAAQVDTLLAMKMDDDFGNAAAPNPISTGGTGASDFVTARKNLGIFEEYLTSDAAFTSNTTYANLAGLSLAVTSGSTWKISITLGVIIAGTGGAKFQVTGGTPSVVGSATMITVFFGGQKGAFPDQAFGSAVALSADNGSFEFEAVLSFGSTGTFVVQGAQFSSDAVATTFKSSGSSMTAIRLS